MGDGDGGVYNWVYVGIYPLDEFDGLWFILLRCYYSKSIVWCFQMALHSLLERAKNTFEAHGFISIHSESNDILVPCPDILCPMSHIQYNSRDKYTSHHV